MLVIIEYRSHSINGVVIKPAHEKVLLFIILQAIKVIFDDNGIRSIDTVLVHQYQPGEIKYIYITVISFYSLISIDV